MGIDPASECIQISLPFRTLTAKTSPASFAKYATASTTEGELRIEAAELNVQAWVKNEVALIER
jgi:hypothetical protein